MKRIFSERCWKNRLRIYVQRCELYFWIAQLLRLLKDFSLSVFTLRENSSFFLVLIKTLLFVFFKNLLHWFLDINPFSGCRILSVHRWVNWLSKLFLLRLTSRSSYLLYWWFIVSQRLLTGSSVKDMGCVCKSIMVFRTRLSISITFTHFTMICSVFFNSDWSFILCWLMSIQCHLF